MAFAPCNRYGVAGIIDDEGRHIVGSDVLHAVRQGRAFRFAHRFTAVAPAAAVDILLDPSANDAATVVRLVLEIDTGVDCSVGIYEVPTVIAPGTELIAYNLNRNGDPSMNSVPAVYHTPTVSAAGTLAAPVAYVTAALPADILYQGTMGDVGAGDAAHGTLPEIYLDRTKKYLVRVTNIGTGAGNTVVAGRLIREPNYYEG
jgi:hypothetical protein